jgi:hypothetical protein
VGVREVFVGKPTARNKLMWAIIMVVVGAIILLPTYRRVRKAKATAEWAETEGVVVSSEMKDSYLRRRREGGPHRTYHKFYVDYRYSVDGTEYRSERFSFSTNYIGEPEKVRFYNDNYGEGQTIKVYYNPARPSESVLIQGLPKFNRPQGRLLMGWFLFGIGILGTVTFGSKVLRERKRPEFVSAGDARIFELK